MTFASRSLPAALDRLWREEEGQGLTEFALLLALATLVCVSSLASLGTSLDPSFLKVAEALRAPAN